MRGAKTSNDEDHKDVKIETNGAGGKEEAAAFSMAKRLSCKWTTGVGHRIGCVRDYPSELQWKALEQVKLSPRVAPGMVKLGPIPSPRPSPRIHLSPRIAAMGLPSPRSIATVS